MFLPALLRSACTSALLVRPPSYLGYYVSDIFTPNSRCLLLRRGGGSVAIRRVLPVLCMTSYLHTSASEVTTLWRYTNLLIIIIIIITMRHVEPFRYRCRGE